MSFFQDPPLRNFPDRAIRRLLSNPSNLRELVEQVDPAVAALLDFSKAIMVKRSFLLDDWRRRESDILFEIPLLAAPDAAPVLLCVLIEHQSEADAWMPLRMLVYAALYWDRKWREWEALPKPRPAPSLPPIIPIVFHTGHRPWKTSRGMADLLGGPEAVRIYAPEWRTLFWDLADRTTAELQAAAGAWLRTLAVVRAEHDEAQPFREVYTEVLRRLDELVAGEKVRRDDLLWFLLSWALIRRPNPEGQGLLDLARAVQINEVRRKEVETMNQTVVRSWADERFAEGEAKGKVEGKAEAIIRTLQARFSAVPPELAAAVVAIQSVERLDALQDVAAVCRNLQEFQARLGH